MKLKTPLLVGDKTIQLGDVADVYRGFSQPAQPRMRFMGENGIGIAVSMRKGGDIIALVKSRNRICPTAKTLPLGMKLQKVSDQPVAVQRSIHEFVKVLAEAVIIVLLVSFLFRLPYGIGGRFSIPLVLAMTFAGMSLFDVGLHKISLGALILALGLLVDDAIIAVEMMAIKMEQGYSRIKSRWICVENYSISDAHGNIDYRGGFYRLLRLSLVQVNTHALSFRL